MKILFMGTPDFAVPSLRALYEAGHEIVGVFTQPDKPKNRGMKMQAPPVKECALEHDTPVYQPLSMKDGTAMDIIRTLSPELIVVAAYGRILPEDILNYPEKGCINVHSSLLPSYRGAAPINWAILNGDKETGVTIMHMAKALDAGDIISQVSTPIGENETAPELHDRLADMGAELLIQTVASIADGSAVRTPQDESKMTYASMLSKSMSQMDWNRSASQLHAQVRGLYPWPAAVTEVAGTRCKVVMSRVASETTGKTPGTVIQADKKGLKIACGDGSVLELVDIQPDGKKKMKAVDFLRGHPIEVNG